MSLEAVPHPRYPLREPCRYCGCHLGSVSRKSGQDVVRCQGCGRHLYNAPRTETGLPRDSLSTRPEIKPKKRARILQRDCHRCIYCGVSALDTELVIGHLLSVNDAAALGLSDADTYDDENLATMCAECNSGIGRESVAARLIAALVKHRANHHAPGNRETV